MTLLTGISSLDNLWSTFLPRLEIWMNVVAFPPLLHGSSLLSSIKLNRVSLHSAGEALKQIRTFWSLPVGCHKGRCDGCADNLWALRNNLGWWLIYTCQKHRLGSWIVQAGDRSFRREDEKDKQGHPCKLQYPPSSAQYFFLLVISTMSTDIRIWL